METMLTIAIFSGILLLCMAIFIFIGRVYYKGLYENRAQAVVRDVVDTISEAIRTSGEKLVYLDCTQGDGTPYSPAVESPCLSQIDDDAWAGYCIGNTGYVWQYNQQLDADDPEPVFVKITNCDGDSDAFASRTEVRGEEGRTELLHKGMRIVKFDINCGFSGDPNLCSINLKIAYGGDPDGNADDNKFDSEVFVFDMDNDPSTSEDKDDWLPEGTATPAFARRRSAHIVRCQDNQSFCAVAELRTNALKRIK